MRSHFSAGINDLSPFRLFIPHSSFRHRVLILTFWADLLCQFEYQPEQPSCIHHLCPAPEGTICAFLIYFPACPAYSPQDVPLYCALWLHVEFKRLTDRVVGLIQQAGFVMSLPVDLPGALVQELEAYILRLRKEAMRNGCMVGYLFDGVTERMVQRGLERACTAAKVRRRHPHDLRHTYATLLLMSHMSPAYVQKQLGHSSITMTVDIYSHWIPGQGRRNLDEIFSPGGGNRRAPSRAFNDVFRTSEG